MKELTEEALTQPSNPPMIASTVQQPVHTLLRKSFTNLL